MTRQQLIVRLWNNRLAAVKSIYIALSKFCEQAVSYALQIPMQTYVSF